MDNVMTADYVQYFICLDLVRKRRFYRKYSTISILTKDGSAHTF